jgi:hypothetical protein
MSARQANATNFHQYLKFKGIAAWTLGKNGDGTFKKIRMNDIATLEATTSGGRRQIMHGCIRMQH